MISRRKPSSENARAKPGSRDLWTTAFTRNAEDPPSAFEQRRNDVIHATYQHNRKPFIDHPEWAPAIFG